MKTKTAVLHLAIAFDANYVTPFYVLLTSVFQNHENCRLAFHVAPTGIPAEECNRIRAFVHSRGAEIFFYDLAGRLRNINLPVRSYFTEATYYRLFLPGLVPAVVEKLLYIDVDTVVIGSLVPLFNTDLEGLPLGGVVQFNSPARPELGIHEPQNYFNAGVLLINVPEWKQQRIFEKAVRFIQQYPEKLHWLDQDVLNAVLAGNFRKLDGGYNVRHNDIPKDLPRKQIKRFLEDKVIIHYTSTNKPWLALGQNRLRFLYHYYLRQSPRTHEKKYRDFKPTGRILLGFIRIRMAELLSDYPLLLHTARKSTKYRKKYLW